MATAPGKDEQVVPKRIVIRHLSGSKVNQVEEFPLDHFNEVKIGRTASSDITYDPDKDDLVSREHARIISDPKDPNQYTIRDLNSRNGIFVNKQKVLGVATIVPTDVIQLGPGGPEFEFDLEPRPDMLMRKTRMAGSAAASAPAADRPTRAGETVEPVAAIPASAAPTAAPAASASEHRPVGKATVERIVAQTEKKSRKHLFYGGAFLIIVVAALIAFFWFQSEETATNLGQQLDDTRRQLQEAEANKPMTPQGIGASFGDATVYFEVGWKLIHTPSGSQVYHQFAQLQNEQGQAVQDQQTGQPIVRAAFVQLEDGVIEPVLTLDSDLGQAIGGQHSGSGFVVSNDGFILTNRHVAASWFTSYHYPQGTFPGILYVQGPDGNYRQAGLIEQEQIQPWVPAEAKFFGFKPISGKIFEGRNDYLDVTFSKNELRIPAQLVRTSNRHDVAMVKVDVPQTLHKVELFDNYDQVQQGNEVTVLGYPGISPEVVVQTQSQDVFNRQQQYVMVPDPTLTAGHVSRIIRGQQAPTGRSSYEYFSTFGDTYQLDINATGGGNSGGPVFDDQGRVIAIYTAGRNWAAFGDAYISFATPIRYGIELMGTRPVL